MDEDAAAEAEVVIDQETVAEGAVVGETETFPCTTASHVVVIDFDRHARKHRRVFLPMRACVKGGFLSMVSIYLLKIKQCFTPADEDMCNQHVHHYEVYDTPHEK